MGHDNISGAKLSDTYWTLAGGDFLQDWSNTGLIGTDDNWSGVPSIVGFRGDGLASATGVDPRTITGEGTPVVDVNANRSDPNTFTTGGIAEFDGIADPVVALQGSGTARAPYLAIYLDTTGRQDITFSTRLRDIDTGSTAVQPIAIQYRVGDSGPWINISGGFVANANTGGDTNVSVTLPADANDQARVQVRVITADAVGSDAFIGVDDIHVSSAAIVAVPVQAGTLSIADATTLEGDNGAHDLVFTVTRANGSDGAVTAEWTVLLNGTADAADLGGEQPLSGTVSFAAGATTAEVRISIAGDTVLEADESFSVTLANPTGGATIGAATATGTIQNDDAAPPPPPPPPPPAAPANVFFNEFHYDNSGTDVGEAIEIAGTAGTDLTGWRIVLYNGNGGTAYATTGGSVNGIALSGIIPDLQNGYGTVSVLAPGIQNGAPDGFALVDAQGRVVQFLSYEGSFTATNGPAAGLTSVDIGVSEEPAPGAGFSLQLVGSGSSAADFTWVAGQTSSFGGLNIGQNFLSDNGPAQLRIGDASVNEGDGATTNLVFTISRAGGLAGANSVDYNVMLDGSADSADFAVGAVFSGTVNFAAGETSKQISVAIAGDTLGETNETFSVVLGNVGGNGAIIDGVAQGLIINDDPISLRIYDIQGAGHRSAFVGQNVTTGGIVTAVDTNGFYIQDATGDGNSRTSDGVFVFTGTTPTVQVGDAATVNGIVSEFVGAAGSLSVTEIVSPTVTITSSGNELPAAVLIGVGGILPPSEAIDDDGLGIFDPENDGIDFWETLEGQRVTIDRPIAVSNTNSFGETDIVASRGEGASGINDRGGITISPNDSPTSKGDFNPEKIQIDDDSGIFAGFTPGYSVGDGLSSVTGIVNYAFSAYEVLVTEAVTLENDVTLQRETTTLKGDANFLSIATYNVENLDASDMKFDILASDIVYRLNAPDILAVQEIQDADGAGTGSDLSGAATAQGLIDAIFAQSGLHYGYIEIAPDTPNTTGGEPNGNIRNGFLYNLDRVSYVTGSAELITGPAYSNSRNPLAATFLFNGQAITAINVHFTSRGGSDPLQGANQPPNDAGDGARTAQAAGVKAYINNHLADNPALNIAVLGDFNGFYFEEAQTQLTDPTQGGSLVNLAVANLAEEERYSFLFEGNAQLIDNILVTGGLALGSQFDAVHLNSQFGGTRPTDHDPQVALLRFAVAPHDLVISNASVAENLPAGTVVGTLGATDTPGDNLTFALTDDAGGLFAVDRATGVVTTTAPLDFEALASYTITAQVTDGAGLTATADLAIAIANVNEAPIAANDQVAVNEDATTADLWATILANDRDPDGDRLTISAVDAQGTLGSVIFDAASQTLRYVADNDAFDNLLPGQTATDHFTYTVTDAAGLTSTATVELTITAVDDGVLRIGTSRRDTLTGTGGEDTLYGVSGNDTLFGRGGNDLLSGGLGNDTINGEDGNDRLFGDAGNDTLSGGAGRDILFGGFGNDRVSGGTGADVFHFGRFDGNDTVLDFSLSEDSIVLDDGLQITRSTVKDTNRDGINDLVLQLTLDTAITLLGVSDLGRIKFDQPDNSGIHHPVFSGLAGSEFDVPLPVSPHVLLPGGIDFGF